MANITKNISIIADSTQCTPLAIDKFPSDFFSEYQREHGAVLFHVGVAIYMFGALSYVCEKYFVPTLEYIVDRFKIRPDVAGVTIMAMGGSLPELVISILGVFVSENDVGVGAMVGSDTFHVLVMSGCAVMAAPKGTINLQVYAVLRDTFVYVLALIPLGILCWDQDITWYKALSLVSLYCGFIVFMLFNSQIERKVIRYFPFLGRWPVLAADCLDERTAILSVNSVNSETVMTNYLQGKNTSYPEISVLEPEDADTCCSLFVFPDSTCYRILWILGLPVIIVFALTIPNPQKDCFRKLFPVTILMCLAYIGISSYLMMWMLTIVGYTVGIPDIVLGLVIVSAGSCIPDVLASVIVSRHGRGNMAIANCLGNNIFDITFGLGLPWLLKTVIFGANVRIYSGSIYYSVFILLGNMIGMNFVFMASKWSPRWPAGVTLWILYIVSISVSCLFEVNKLGKFNLPLCSP